MPPTSSRPQILKLRGDNFTDPARTPWGGDRVAAWKRALGIDAHSPLGESWEVSFGPELPSFVAGSFASGEQQPLSELVAQDPVGYLGDEASLGTSALLVKLLDTSAPLSVQIHPRDEDPKLGPDESGKPECWYVADAEEGAEVLFGLSDAATPGRMRSMLEAGGDVTSMLSRFAVRAGDFFVVPPGTPHAIGAGITMVEPQRVTPGRRGITYRYWDHARRYDARGRLHPSGQLRPLHVEDALRVTDWEGARFSILRESAYRHVPRRSGALSLETLCGPGAPLPFVVEVAVLCGSGSMHLPTASVGRSLTVLDGFVEVESQPARRAESLFLPASRPMEIQGRDVLAIMASVPWPRASSRSPSSEG